MASLMNQPYSQFFDSNGDPLSGGKIYTYDAGTTTPRNTYTSQNESVVAANPVILDSAGRAAIWLSGSYRIDVKTSADVLVRSTDNVTAAFATGDMNKSTYDPANIGEQLVGLNAAQTLTNKTFTSPTLITPTLGVATATSVNFGQGAELNYYDEGTFTPVVAGSTTPGTGATYTYQFGYYVRQGSVVRFHIYVDYSGLSGATGTFRITGLPFTSRNVANMFWSVFVPYQANLTVPASAMVSGLVPANTSRVDLYSTTTGGGTSTLLAIDAASSVIVCGEYFV